MKMERKYATKSQRHEVSQKGSLSLSCNLVFLCALVAMF